MYINGCKGTSLLYTLCSCPLEIYSLFEIFTKIIWKSFKRPTPLVVQNNLFFCLCHIQILLEERPDILSGNEYSFLHKTHTDKTTHTRYWMLVRELYHAHFHLAAELCHALTYVHALFPPSPNSPHFGSHRLWNVIGHVIQWLIFL